MKGQFKSCKDSEVFWVDRVMSLIRNIKSTPVLFSTSFQKYCSDLCLDHIIL